MASAKRAVTVTILAFACGTPPPEVDVVASVALEQASQSGDAAILTALLEPRFRSSGCSNGPVEFSCQEEARARLDIVECQSMPDTEQVVASHTDLAALVLDALRIGERVLLTRHAACDFSTGWCWSDAGRARLPAEPVAELLATTPSPRQLHLVETHESWALYRADESEVHLQFEQRPETNGWVWSGICRPYKRASERRPHNKRLQLTAAVGGVRRGQRSGGRSGGRLASARRSVVRWGTRGRS